MQSIADHGNFNSLGDFSSVFGFRSRDSQREKALEAYLFLRLSFLVRLLVTAFKDDDAGALACPVAFRWSNSLFRDGNSLRQVVQLIGTSL